MYNTPTRSSAEIEKVRNANRVGQKVSFLQRSDLGWKSQAVGNLVVSHRQMKLNFLALTYLQILTPGAL